MAAYIQYPTPRDLTRDRLFGLWDALLTELFTADIISTVEFDHTGNYLATGDKGGRVVLFERNETVRPQSMLT
jgi:hypothetical protein